MDLDGEIIKCEKKLALAKMNLSKVEKVESQADYESTVPENVRLANEEKVSPDLSSCLAMVRRFLVLPLYRGKRSKRISSCSSTLSTCSRR